MSIPQVTLHVGQEVHGFVVKAVTPLESMRSVACELNHCRTGARVIHLYAEDSENLFSVSFPTPPSDDTGVPHILEHAVLAGSERFPVRDPFFEMYKMSMATFINAMTGLDCTYYPVSSNVKQDLFNLAEVYFDAVFHPLLTEETFRREGHHLAPVDKEQPAGPLTINGIVYNEMKGAFSHPESRLFLNVMRTLFPNSPYGKESGGDPDHIPELTWEGLTSFHRTFYHPGNAYFVFYGNIPTEEYLAFLADRLKGFESRGESPAIARQPRWGRARSVEDDYSIGREEPPAEKTYISITWLVGDATDAADLAALRILSQILLGNEAAPLKRAIIASKLGQDLIYSGTTTAGIETIFDVGIKGSEPERTAAFEQLVAGTLRQVADGPIERDAIDAAFHQIAYRYLEIQSGFPLSLMQWVLSGWTYQVDPLSFVRMRDHLESARSRSLADPQFFQRLIRERLLDNPHRVTAVLRPDPEWQERTEAAFSERMQQVRAKYSESQLRRIGEEAEELARRSGTPNSPAALATLPQLSVKDLPPHPEHIRTTIDRLPNGVVLLRNDVFANSVNYLVLDFDLTGLPNELWPYLGRHGDAVRKMGAAGLGFEQMARRIAASLGDLQSEAAFFGHASDPARCLRRVQLSAKALDDQVDEALAVIRDLLFSVDPRDRERLREVLVQSRAWYQENLVHNGSGTAAKHAARGITPAAYLTEIVRGLPQLPLINRLTDRFEELDEEVMAKIERVRDFLLNRARLTASFTGSDAAYDRLRAALEDWSDRMATDPPRDVRLEFEPFAEPPREGLAAPIQVAHCTQVMPAPHLSHPNEPFLTVGSRIINLDYMINEIRFKGNAYGAWCNYDGMSRTLSLGSYNDPHVARTLKVFAGVTDYVRQSRWTQTDIDRAIIGTARNFVYPIRPASATGQALYQYLAGLTPEVREERYEQVRSSTPDNVKTALLEMLEDNLKRGAICVVAGREKLEQANRDMPEAPLAVQDILG